MALIHTINEDLKGAMKSGDKARVEVLRFALAGLNAAQKEKTLKGDDSLLTDDEVISVLQKDAKRRKESIELFRQGNRNDLVEKEEGELAIIASYLPKELSAAEIDAAVEAAKAKGATDFSSLMRETMKEVKGRADGKTVTEAVKRALGQ